MSGQARETGGGLMVGTLRHSQTKTLIAEPGDEPSPRCEAWWMEQTEGEFDPTWLAQPMPLLLHPYTGGVIGMVHSIEPFAPKRTRAEVITVE